MSKRDDGGPAFPQTAMGDGINAARDWPWDGYGMGGLSMRDYFAAAALSGSLSRDRQDYGGEVHAKFAYAAADAMIAERNKP